MHVLARPRPAPPFPDDVQVLVREARRLQRRRWRRVGLAVLVAAAAAVTGVVVSGRRGPPPRQRAGRSVSRPPGSSRGRNGPATVAPTAVAGMGRLTASTGWADTCGGLYRTDNDGTGWVDITPPNLRRTSCVSEHIGSVASFGSSDLWVSAVNVPWLNVSSCGGCINPPGYAVDYTTDSGATWRSSGACGQAGCDFTQMSFTDPRHGIAGGGYVMSTADGGKTWSLVGDGPKALESAERAPDGRLWGVIATGPVAGVAGQLATLAVRHPCACGGARTPQIGSAPEKLPLVQPYGERPTTTALPTFFGQDGVLPARLVDAPAHVDVLVVYSTTDGGTTWSARRGPAGAGLGSYPDDGQFDLPFTALSPQRWVLDVGRRVFETGDAGRIWSSTGSRGLPGRAVWSVNFATPMSGWAIAAGPACPSGICAFVPDLYRTTDGGKDWSELSPP